MQGFLPRRMQISCLNDSETQERGLLGVKMQKISCCSMPLDDLLKSLHNLSVQEICQYLPLIHPLNLAWNWGVNCSCTGQQEGTSVNQL